MCILYTIWSLYVIMESDFQQFSDFFFFFFHYQSNKFEANLLAKVTNKCRDKYVICLKCSGVGI